MAHNLHPACVPTTKALAKSCVGEKRRIDRKGTSPRATARLFRESLSGIVPSGNRDMVDADGLESHPPGSIGKVSRPVTMKLLNVPPVTAAQR